MRCFGAQMGVQDQKRSVYPLSSFQNSSCGGCSHAAFLLKKLIPAAFKHLKTSSTLIQNMARQLL